MKVSFLNTNMPIFRQNNYIPPKPKETKGFRNFEHLHCALCGDEMMLHRTKNDITRQLFDENGNVLPSAKSIDVFKQTITYLPPEETNVVILLDKYAQRYPDKTFEEIFQIPDVINPLLKMKSRKEQDYRIKFNKVFDELEKSFSDLPDSEKEKLGIFREKLLYNGYSKKSSEMKKYTTRKIVVEFAKEMGIVNPETLANMHKIADKIPFKKPDEIILICKYFGKKDEQILRSLLRNRLATIRHFGPPPHDNSYKMLCFCERCNTETGNLSLKEMIEQFKNMPNNIRKFVMDISRNLLVKDVGVGKDYPEKFRQYLKEQTGFSLVVPSLDVLRREKFLLKYPKVREALAATESIAKQRERIHQVEVRIKTLKRKNAEPTQIDEYRFLLNLLVKKLEDSKKAR